MRMKNIWSTVAILIQIKLIILSQRKFLKNLNIPMYILTEALMSLPLEDLRYLVMELNKDMF